MAAISENGLTDFAGQDMELDTGEWTADDFGVRKPGLAGTYVIACSHPIMPIERLRNINTGELKVRIAYRRGDRERKIWSTFLADFTTISNARNIVELSKIGISVTSGQRAQSLVDYLCDMMDRNYDLIPETKSVSRVGWYEDFGGFSPYVKDVIFDGNANFAPIYNSIRSAGSFEDWQATAWVCRHSVATRLILAASFASALVAPLGCLPFFVHLWGMDSGTGKTVAQMLAVSVWGIPTVGSPLFPTFKATSVGFEVIAGFLNSLPVVIDELQLAKDAHGRVNFNVYELASGSGKLRSNKTLGLATTPTWANCFITSGETPIVGENDGAGAVNRVIEIECKSSAKLIDDGHMVASNLKQTYGHAGKVFVGKLLEDGNLDRARKIYEQYYADCLKSDTTEKQAMAAAVILTGDRLATEWIFETSDYLKVSDIAEFLKSKDAVSASERGYGYICDWVSQNYARFSADSTGEVYGSICEDVAYIIRRAFNDACEEGGINAKALLSHMKSKGQIITRGRAMTVSRRINGIQTECVALKLISEQ